jgi:alpha-L-fucosidase
LKIVEGITEWMDLNSECIYETRPWHIYGEGPKAEQANPLKAQGFNEGRGGAYTAEDIRFTSKGAVLYAVMMEKPARGQRILIKSLADGNPYFKDDFDAVDLLGAGTVSYKSTKAGLEIRLPDTNKLTAPLVLKIY